MVPKEVLHISPNDQVFIKNTTKSRVLLFPEGICYGREHFTSLWCTKRKGCQYLKTFQSMDLGRLYRSPTSARIFAESEETRCNKDVLSASRRMPWLCVYVHLGGGEGQDNNFFATGLLGPLIKHYDNLSSATVLPRGSMCS